MRNIEVYLCSKNVNFTPSDVNRPLFHDKWNGTGNVPARTLDRFKTTYFSDRADVNNFNELSVLTATLNVYMPHGLSKEIYKSKNYCLITIDGYDRYYFITSARIMNDTTIKYTLKLDTITTYLHILTWGGSAKIDRMHTDGWYDISGLDYKFPNFKKDSLLWNPEDNMPVNKVVWDSKKIDVISDDIKTRLGFKAGKNYWWPTILSETNREIFIPQLDHPGTRIDLTTYTYSGNYLIALNPIGDSTRINAGDPSNPDTTYKWATLIDWYRRAGFAQYINVIYASPLPLLNLETVSKFYNANDTYIRKLKDVNHLDTAYVPDPIMMSFSGQYVGPDDFAYHTRYDWTFNLANEITDEINGSGKTFKEGKTYSQQFIEFSIRSVSGEKYVIPSELIGYQSSKLKLYPHLTNSGVGLTGVISGLLRDFGQYDINKSNAVNDRTFNIEFSDPLPSISSFWQEYLKSNSSQYKAGIAANKANAAATAGFGIATGTLTAGLGLLSGNPLAGITGGLAIGKAVGDAGKSITAGIAQDKVFKAKREDMIRQGTSMNLNNYSVVKDMLTESEFGKFGDSKLAFVKERPFDSELKRVDDYFVKFGYSDGTIRNITNYSFFNTRRRFTYVQSPIISEAFQKTIPQEAMQDINRIFQQGVRLWADWENIGNYHQPNREFLWKN